ncbi:MAG: hypothetical protein ACP5NP_09200 [Acetobacteraceae bacterium]
MTTRAALRRLLEVLERENAALAALDLGAAGAFGPEKAAALAACAGPPEPDQRALLEALAVAARENRVRLEHALAVQARVIALVARAARPAARYGPAGRGAASAQALWARV